jgi:hypothetical protein
MLQREPNGIRVTGPELDELRKLHKAKADKVLNELWNRKALREEVL